MSVKIQFLTLSESLLRFGSIVKLTLQLFSEVLQSKNQSQRKDVCIQPFPKALVHLIHGTVHQFIPHTQQVPANMVHSFFPCVLAFDSFYINLLKGVR